MKNEIKCAVLENLIKEHKTPALFIGAGFSKRYLENYYNWSELLLQIGKEIGVPEFIITSRYNAYIAEGNDEGVAKQKIGTFLENKLNEKIQNGDYSSIFSKEEQELITKNNYSPFKFLISRLLKNIVIKKDKTYLLTELNYFKKLVSKIPCIITTNYDTLIEKLFGEKFTTYINQEDYFYNHNCLNAEIYKIHGSITAPNSLVITDNDYNNFSQKAHLTIAKLLSILSLHPIVFIGYSLSDSNIQMLFEQLLECINEQQLQDLEKNLIFVEFKEHCISMNSNNYKEIKLKNKSIKATYIITDNFTRLYQYLNQCAPVASPLEIKKYYSLIRQIVIDNNEESKRIVGRLADLDKLPEEIAITDLAISDVSYTKINATDLMLDVLYEKNKYDAFSVIEKWFSQGIARNSNAPLYYYLKKCFKENKTFSDNVKLKINDYLKHKKTIKIAEKQLFPTKMLLDAELAKIEKDTKKLDVLTYNYYSGQITRKQFTDRLKKIYENDNSILTSSEFKKAILILDYDKKIKI